MYSPDSSPLSSPARKRQRLSSPTYDEQLGDLSQADLDAFDQIEARLSQSPRKNSSSVGGHHLASPDDSTFMTTSAVELTDDPENPFTTGFIAASSSGLVTTSNFTTASALVLSSTTITSGFSRASAIVVEHHADGSRNFDRSPSPEEPPNQDFDTWFQPAGTIPHTSFTTASTTLPNLGTPVAVGFTTASNKGLIAPSSAALAKAQARMKEIWQESETAVASIERPPNSLTDDSENEFRPASSISSRVSPRRLALQSVGNSLDSPSLGSPSTPTPATFSRSSGMSPAMTPTELFINRNSKPFKSPLLMKNLKSTSIAESIQNSNHHLTASTTAKPQHPLASAPITANSLSTGSGFLSTFTPIQHSRYRGPGSNLKRSTPAAFVTPFKPGMKPGQPGRLKLEALKASQLELASSTQGETDWLSKDRPGDKAGRRSWTGVFNLTPPPNRQTLQSSGLVPQQYTSGELEALGINPTELSQITSSLAMYYSFHTPASTPLLPLTSTPPTMLGPKQAYISLLENGCTLATQAWVDNHWGLILWKLAGMVGLDPQRESIPDQKRWCWAEVMRQILYRYEREHNRGKRPPLRLVATRDAPAAYPMILCVSDILWVSPVCADAELEVTDGWYRLRARIDAPMARAVKKGHIRIGRKIGVAGAYLSSEKKDPSEILDAYNSVKLVLSGNSSHMVPWHAKLGFDPGPCISTLHSLTPDGGMVTAMDLVVVKTHPIAFIELMPVENGYEYREGPMNAADEAVAHEKWKKQWEHEMSKLRAEYEKKWDRYENYLDRLDRRVGLEELTSSQDDFPLDVLESIYDELENPAEALAVLAGLGRKECVSLARFIRDRLQKEKNHASEDMENELKHICPARIVKNFRIIVVQDARTRKHPGNRTALLNVWDVMNLSFCEGASPGSFEIGQRFMVTNLKPTHHKSWMGHESGAEVYLCTGQYSRWTPIKA